MKPGAGMVWSGCLFLLMAACAESGERAPARAPSSTQAEEAPARPIATSLSSDPLDEAAQEHHVGNRHDHAAEPASGSQGEATVYTCPMHPEVQQAGPGECPKCGMKLVPKSSPDAAHEHAN